MATVIPLPIDITQDAENIEFDIREYASPGSPGTTVNTDHLATIVAAKIVQAAIDNQTTQIKNAIDAQTTALTTAITAQTTALETAIDNNTDTIKNSIDLQTVEHATIADKQTIVADKQTAIETYQKRLKELGETSGIRNRGPFETWGNISTYKFLIEQAKILDETNKASPEQQARALAVIQDYLGLINQQGKEF